MSDVFRPTVTVVIPMYNEAGAIDECLDGFGAQTYPKERLDVIVVDGGSTDGSRRAVEERLPADSWLRVVDNPRRRIPVACNLGLHAAKGEVVCFFSSHGVPSPTFVEQAVRVLGETGAVGVGGAYLHVGLGPVSTAIGLAMSSPFGMASPHRFRTSRGEVDTISHPAYRIESVLAVGGFDEGMERNEDYELNWRLRQQGARLVFDPSISSTYRPRQSLVRLGRQFWWYGWWKARVARQHRGSLRPRHVVPPVAVAVATLAPVLARARSGRMALGLAATGYGGLVCAAVARVRPRSHGASGLVMAAAFPTMHAAWGAGFAASFLRTALHRR